MRSIRLVLLVLIAGCADLEYGTADSEVIGGTAAVEGQFPGVGALMYDIGNGSPEAACTGTLIAPDVVLTAAHCVDPQLVGNQMPLFTLALDTKAGSPVLVASKMTIKHEMFSLDGVSGDGLGHAFDVGLVLLAQPITDVQPVLMPRPVDSPFIIADLDMQIAGYGKTTTQSNEIGVLFQAQTKLVSLDETEIQVGMGAPQPQNCNGDSGGPGFATVGGKRRVIGIVSRSFSGLECTMGGIDTRVDAYTDWIASKTTMSVFPCDSGRAEACPDDGSGGDDGGGCCSTSRGGGPGAGLLAFAVGLALVRRRN